MFSKATRTGIHTTIHKGTAASCVYMVHRRKTRSVVVACGDKTQHELILFKYKKWWVVELVLSELMVADIDGARRHDAQELTVKKTVRRTRHQ